MKDEQIREKQYNRVQNSINLYKKQIDILQDKIIKIRKKYPEYPSHYENVPDNYVLISKGDDLEAKWVHLYDECGEIGTWNHPSLKAWQRFREILLNKKCK